MKRFIPILVLMLFVLPLIASAQGVDPVTAICNILQVVKVF